MERDFIPSWETREMTHEVELLALIEELDSAISRDRDASVALLVAMKPAQQPWRGS